MNSVICKWNYSFIVKGASDPASLFHFPPPSTHFPSQTMHTSHLHLTGDIEHLRNTLNAFLKPFCKYLPLFNTCILLLWLQDKSGSALIGTVIMLSFKYLKKILSALKFSFCSLHVLLCPLTKITFAAYSSLIFSSSTVLSLLTVILIPLSHSLWWLLLLHIDCLCCAPSSQSFYILAVEVCTFTVCSLGRPGWTVLPVTGRTGHLLIQG